MTGNLTFRLFQPDDIEGVLRLWREDSGWGGITERQFYDWYMNTPYGECLIAVALNEENRIVGQEIFTPTRIYVGGIEKKALRLSAPILAKEYREKISDSAHPTVEMYRVGMNAAIMNGYSVVYSFPVVAWLPFLRRLSQLPGLKQNQFATAKFDCYALPLKSFSTKNSADKEGFEVSLATEFNEEYNELWQRAKNEFPINCAIMRSSDWLKWKLGSHFVFEVRRNDDKKLIGYAAIKKDTGLLVDTARSPQDLETTITATVKVLSESENLGNQANIKEIKVMKIEALASVIEKLGFKREKFKFAFWCYSIDESVPIQSLEPSRWYMMPKD